MYKWSFARSVSVFVILTITSTSLFAQSGRFRDAKVMRNDLSRKEKNLVTTSKVQNDTGEEPHASVDRDHQSAATPRQIQKQQLTDEEVVSIVIVTALVLIVFVGLKRT
jgi:hypothetical protein